MGAEGISTYLMFPAWKGGLKGGVTDSIELRGLNYDLSHAELTYLTLL